MYSSARARTWCVVHVTDKQRLEIVKTLRPAPAKVAAHVELTRGGHYTLLSICDMDGALVVYDANTLEQIKRIPMKKPSWKIQRLRSRTRLGPAIDAGARPRSLHAVTARLKTAVTAS
jgi:Cytochrome D1 heme domain